MKKLVLVIFVLSIQILGQDNKGSIAGKVIDKITKEAIVGANIMIAGTTIGAAADINGEFEISNLDVGNYQLQVSSIGYKTVVKTDVIVSTARPPYLTIELMETAIELEGVTVKAEYFDMNPTELNSLTGFSYEEIRRAPGGLEDVVRNLSILPGVAQVSAGRNDLVVRGGAPSENLFVVDGYTVPNINHFGTQGATGGPLSYINLDYVANTTFSTGGFSSLYGDKLSSVLSINLREGRTDRIGGKAAIAASQFGLNLEGPVSGKGNFLFSIRRSYLDFIFNAAGFNFVPEYWDLLAKGVYEFDTHNKLSFLFIGAIDNVKFNNNDAEDKYDNSRILGNDQKQYLLGITFRHLFDKGFFTLQLDRNYVDYNFLQRDSLLNPIFLNNSLEAENEFEAEMVLKLSSTSELNAGVTTKLINFSSDINFPIFATSFGDTLNINQLSVNENYLKYSAYIQYSDVFFNRLSYSIGGRVDYFGGIKNGFVASPRFAASYKIDEITSLSFSSGIYTQFPSYIWLTAVKSNENLKPVKVNQYILGIERLLNYDLRVKLEAYYKDYKDYPASELRPYLVLANTGVGFAGANDNFSTFGLEPLVSKGVGNVKGFELSMQKKSSENPYYGILSLTYSESEFTALDGVSRPSAYDQKWIFNLSTGYIFNEKWEASLRFRFATGNPYTPYNLDGSQSVSNYLSERFKPLHSLDLRVDRKWNFDSWKLTAYIDVQNVYNNKYSNSISYNYRENKVKEGSSLGIFPTIGINAEF